jgi:hypothetical protein
MLVVVLIVALMLAGDGVDSGGDGGSGCDGDGGRGGDSDGGGSDGSGDGGYYGCRNYPIILGEIHTQSGSVYEYSIKIKKC